MPDTTPTGPRKRINTRARLVEAADALIRTTGRTWFSVEQLCRGAGFTRGAFYSNYGSIDELLVDVHERQNNQLLAAVQRSVALLAGEKPADGRALVEQLLDANPTDQPRIALRAALVARANHDPALALALDQQVERLRTGLQEAFMAIINKAGRQLTVSPEVFTRTVMAAQAGAASQFVTDSESNREVRVLAVLSVAESLTQPRNQLAADLPRM